MIRPIVAVGVTFSRPFGRVLRVRMAVPVDLDRELGGPRRPGRGQSQRMMRHPAAARGQQQGEHLRDPRTRRSAARAAPGDDIRPAPSRGHRSRVDGFFAAAVKGRRQLIGLYSAFW